MRPGLVVIGAVLIVLGGGVLGTTLTVPSGGGNGVSHDLKIDLAPGASARTLVYGVNATGSVLAIAWSATGPAVVAVDSAPGCHGTASACTPGAAVAAWSSNRSGAWSTDGSVAFPLLVTVRDAGESNLSIDLVVSVSAAANPALPSLTLLIDLIAGVALTAIGGLALFLGLFLRSGVFARPPRPGPG